MREWAMGITEFALEKYTTRDMSSEDCPRCGAKKGYFCFEMSTAGSGKYAHLAAFPIRAHVIPAFTMEESGEIPVEHQAMTSGQLKHFGS